MDKPVTTKPFSDMPTAVRHHGVDLLALVEQQIRAAYLKGVADGIAMYPKPEADITKVSA